MSANFTITERDGHMATLTTPQQPDANSDNNKTQAALTGSGVAPGGGVAGGVVTGGGDCAPSVGGSGVIGMVAPPSGGVAGGVVVDGGVALGGVVPGVDGATGVAVGGGLAGGGVAGGGGSGMPGGGPGGFVRSTATTPSAAFGGPADGEGLGGM